jgi:leucyl aminopeptidase
MIPRISLTDKEQMIENLVLVLPGVDALPSGLFSKAEKEYIRRQKEINKKDLVAFNRVDYRVYICFIPSAGNGYVRLESLRKAGDSVGGMAGEHKAGKVTVFDAGNLREEVLAFCEGMALGQYRFLKYKQDQSEEGSLASIEIYSPVIEEADVERLNILTDAVSRCRSLINEPVMTLTATAFSREVEKLAKACGATVEVMNRQKIQALKMGGLLGVNQGSHEPPTFTVMEWKPAGAVNRKPVVLVGKGVVYDTGGMNLKPGDSMLNMKDDMSGAAAVACAIYALALAKVPVHVVGLMPATDNRPGEKALVPGDVIRMHNGMTVEVLNTDAEGRLILADALSYAKKYKPVLVIDMATLTGSAVRAIGKYAAVAMQVKAATHMEAIRESGFRVNERLVEFPMWEDYGELIKSDLADLKNIGPAEAGSITAAKFLEKFTDYPYIHLDIAGPAFSEKHDTYRGTGGAGFGVRLLFDFITFAKNEDRWNRL